MTTNDLPYRFFVYGSTRDDDDSGNAWTAKFVDGCVKAYDAKIYGHKIYKRIDQTFPFSIKTNNAKDFVVGRVLEFKKDLFLKKLTHADRINGYDPNKHENENYYQRVIVDAYLQNDSTKVTEQIKAISYIQNVGTTPLSKCIEIPFNDWMKRHTLNNSNINYKKYDKMGKYSKYKKISKIKQKQNVKKSKYLETTGKKNDDNEIKVSEDTFDKNVNEIRGDGICKLKFKSWLCDSIGMKQYFELFAKNDCDSVKFIEFLDEGMLKDTISIKNAVHVQYMLKEITVFKEMMNEFEEYLNKTDELKEYKLRLKQIGVLRVMDLNNDFKDLNELKSKLKIVSDEKATDLWNIIHPQEGM